MSRIYNGGRKKVRLTTRDLAPFDWEADGARLRKRPALKNNPDVARTMSEWDGDYPDAPPSGMDYERRPTPYTVYPDDRPRPLCDIAHAIAQGRDPAGFPTLTGGMRVMPKIHPTRTPKASAE